jgi:hypothetical protein
LASASKCLAKLEKYSLDQAADAANTGWRGGRNRATVAASDRAFSIHVLSAAAFGTE